MTNLRYFLWLGDDRMVFGPYDDDDITNVARLQWNAREFGATLYATRATSHYLASNKFAKIKR